MADRRSFDTSRSLDARLKFGLVALVGLSAGLISLQGDASLPVVGGAVVGGVLVGVALVWWLVPQYEDRDDRRRSGRR